MEHTQTTFRFGLFELDLRAGELRRSGTRLSLQGQPFHLLALLVERAGEVVTREEIRRRLWGREVHVDFDNSLNAAASRLREALRDSSSNPRFIETVPRKGYRFIAPVESVESTVAARPLSTGAWWGALATLFLFTVSVFLFFWLRGRESVESVPPRQKLKLAVIPFENLSDDPEQEYLSDGLTEELIAQLGELNPERLGVIARTSVMRYKGAGAAVDQIGGELGVHYVLEGTLRKEGETARITTRLIDVESQTPLWADTFDEELTAFFALEQEIAAHVADALALELLSAHRPDSGSDRTDNPRTYELYLLGRHFLNQRSMEGFERARRAFEEALSEDPDYAPAHRGLAETYALRGEYDILRPREAFPKAIEMVSRALELDPTSAEGLLLLAYLRAAYEWDWTSAEKAYRQAVAVNPNLVQAHQWYANYMSILGRHDEAVAAAGRARELDPLSSVVNADLCWQYFLARRFDEAIVQCGQTIELDPDFLPAHDNLKWSLILAERDEEACEAFLRVVELEGHGTDTVQKLGGICEKEGIEGLLREALTSPEERSQAPQESPYDIAIDYATLGDVTSALDWLERAYDVGETDLIGLGVDPRLDPLRSEPRFEELLGRLGLPRAGVAIRPGR